MTAPALEIENLQRSFGALTAANNISFALPRGARYALIGPNGAGKTTLVNLITGRLRSSAGKVLLDGDEITALSQAARTRRGIARTFQVNQLFRGLTVLENVYLAIGERTQVPAIGCGDPPGRKPRSSTKRSIIWNRSRSSTTPAGPCANCPTGDSAW